MTSESQLAVAYSSNDQGFVQLGVAIHSLVETAPSDKSYRIYVLSDGISENHKNAIQQVVESPQAGHRLRFIEVSAVLADHHFPINPAWPAAAWARIFIPDLLPDEHRVLYCDIDTLICRPLTELENLDMQGMALGVVFEEISQVDSDFNERLSIPLDCPGYFNSGVLLMDLDAFRREGLVQRILDYAGKFREQLICPDQDALNGALCNHLIRLHSRWNWHDGLTRSLLKPRASRLLMRGAGLKEEVEAALEPGILHYQGAHKPWNYNWRIEGPRYEAALRGSSLGNLPLPGRTITKIIKKRLHQPVYALTWRRIRRLDALLCKKAAAIPPHSTSI
jgi:lipopolysaccharide biosynthesis glycosyltransferase